MMMHLFPAHKSIYLSRNAQLLDNDSLHFSTRGTATGVIEQCTFLCETILTMHFTTRYYMYMYVCLCVTALWGGCRDTRRERGSDHKVYCVHDMSIYIYEESWMKRCNARERLIECESFRWIKDNFWLMTCTRLKRIVHYHMHRETLNVSGKVNCPNLLKHIWNFI